MWGVARPAPGALRRGVRGVARTGYDGAVVWRAIRWTAGVAGALALASVLAVATLRFIDPLVTPLMLLRLVGGWVHGPRVGLDCRQVDLDDVSPALVRAVIASEDARFFSHSGIDWDALEEARAYNARHAGGRLHGASTITMQCARSVFLWPGRTWLRKGLEVWLAKVMEFVLPKRRILELYLNVVEWGPGIYGAEAAARRWFGVGAAQLDARQAALLAAVLPGPLRWRPSAPTAYVASRARVIARRAGSVQLAPLAD